MSIRGIQGILSLRRLCSVSQVFLVFVVLFLFPALLQWRIFAQTETGQIVGMVKDQSGAVVSGANVTIISVTTQAKRQTTSDEGGNFTVTNLLPSVYEVVIEASGFTTRKQQVQITVGSRLALEAILEVGQTNSLVIEITGDSGIRVNTESQSLSSVITQTQLRELPTITRNPYDLVQLSGNVAATNTTNNRPSVFRGVGYAINGQRSASVNLLLDGSDNNNQFSSQVGQAVPLDSVQEFSVITSNFSAEYGRAGGGVINVATKSGTNEFHGTAYEFNRISALAANTFENKAQFKKVEKGTFTRNQFGYSIGGPVLKDKVFFFSSGEFIRVRSSAPQFFLAPTPQLLAVSNLATRNFFNPFQLISPISGRIFTRGDFGDIPEGPFQKLPSNFPAFGQTIVNLPSDAGGGNPQNTYQFVNRADWNISEKTSLYVRYALEKKNLLPGTISVSPYKGFNTGEENFNNNVLASLTHTFSPRFTTQTKVVYNRLNSLQSIAEQPLGPTLTMLGVSVASFAGTKFAFPGYFPTSPSDSLPLGGPQNVIQFYEDVGYSIGNHNLRFGGSYVRIMDNRTFGAFAGAIETLGRNLGEGLNNLVAGQLYQFQAAVDPQGKFPGDTIKLPVNPPSFTRNNRYNEFAFYFNDSWRIHSRVLLNLGIRYEYYGVQHNTDRRLDSNFYLGQGANIFEQIKNGKVQIAEDSSIGDLYAKDKNNFAPRVGLAWDIFGNGKTSLRGGYGISYERNFGNVTFNVIQNPPNYAVLSLINGTDVEKGQLPITLNNAGPLAGTGTSVIPVTSLRALNQNLHNAYVHFWSASLDHQLFKNTVVSVDYSGSRGVDLYSLENPNRPGSAAIYLGDRSHLNDPNNPSKIARLRLNTQYSNINLRGNNGFSLYHGLTFGFQSRNLANTGLYLTTKYTWSHAIDNLSSTFSEGANNVNLGLLDPFNPKLDKGDADFDVRHRFVTSGVWEIPFAKNTNGWMKHMLDGWQVSYIYTVQSGTPFTIYDSSKSLQITSRLVQIGSLNRSGSGNPTPIPGQPNLFRYLDLSGQKAGAGSYINPITGTSDFGPYPANMTGRNAFRAPGRWDLDASISKKININEKYSLQLRFEFYNFFNHPNLLLVSSQTDIASTNFIPAVRGPSDPTLDVGGRRQIQIGLKFLF